jgi:Fe-S cluster assembly scaffold protein SufB
MVIRRLRRVAARKHDHAPFKPLWATLAEQGYKAYGDEVCWVAHTGKEMPSWDELPEKQRKAWIAAASRITELVV